MDQLTPVDSGPGIVIFDPQMKGADQRIGNFGAGCTRWLHIAVGGLPEMGKTPTWGTVDNVRRGLKFSNFRLDPARARKVARKVGVPVFVTSEIKGNANGIKWLVHVWRTNEPSRSSTDFNMAGSPKEMIDWLPQLADVITIASGIRGRPPYLPKEIHASPEEMAYLGALPWKPRAGLPQTDLPRLTKLARRLPLAGIMLWRGDLLKTENAKFAVLNAMLGAAPNNALIYAELQGDDTDFLMNCAKSLDELSRKYPHNYLLATSKYRSYGLLNDFGSQREAIERAVRCSPSNPVAWNDLSQSYSDEAQNIRRGQYANELSSSQWDALNDLYAKAQQAVEKSIVLEPNWGYSWGRLAEAATFAGDPETADEALWKSLSLDPSLRPTYYWGFQMYQPKWTDQPQKLLKLAKFMAAHADQCEVPVETMVSSLHSVDLEDQKGPLIEECFRRDPNNPEALYHMGTILHYDRRQYRKAEQYYRKAIALSPDYARPYTGLGDLYLFVKNDSRTAEQLYRKAIDLYKYDPLFYCNLARCVLKQGRRDEAAKLAKKALELDADTSHPIFAELDMAQ